MPLGTRCRRCVVTSSCVCRRVSVLMDRSSNDGSGSSCDLRQDDRPRDTPAQVSAICPVHHEALLYYCLQDEEAVCSTCTREHLSHQVRPIQEASEEKRLLGRDLIWRLTAQMSGDEKQAHALQQRRAAAEERIALIRHKVDDLFRDLRKQLDELEVKVRDEISGWEEQTSLSLSDMMQRLDVHKEALSRTMSHMEDLCSSPDPLSVLRDWKSGEDDFGQWESESNSVNKSADETHESNSANKSADETRESNSANKSADETRESNIANKSADETHESNRANKSMDEMREGLISATLHAGLSDIVSNVKGGFYLDQDVALDENTAANDIHLSMDLKTASSSEVGQSRPWMPERFQYSQVLSRGSFLGGRHYWEVETSEGGNWRLGVTYPSIPRKGYHSLIGHSNKSWGLCRYFNQYMAVHDKRVMAVTHKPLGQRLAVYLDYEAGHLSFYELRDPVTHLYSFSGTFSEPLHLVLGVYAGWVTLRN
ncbi:E3 ubiquitin-protein ligase TRIM11-like [Gastrophryne carolinensis]